MIREQLLKCPQQILVEAEAKLSFGVSLGRSCGNWCTHGSGVSRFGGC